MSMFGDRGPSFFDVLMIAVLIVAIPIVIAGQYNMMHPPEFEVNLLDAEGKVTRTVTILGEPKETDRGWSMHEKGTNTVIYWDGSIEARYIENE